MGDLVKMIGQTPLPTIFVVAGIACWILAIAGSIAGQITIEPSRRFTAQVAGTVFIGLGLALLFLTPGNRTDAEATANPRPVSSSSTPPAIPVPPTVPAGSTFGTASADSTSPAPASHSRPNPAVNCNGTPDEVAICANAQLRELDWQLHDVYVEKLKGTDQARQSQLVRDENLWIKQRNSCASNIDCLVTAYQLRLSQLRH